MTEEEYDFLFRLWEGLAPKASEGSGCQFQADTALAILRADRDRWSAKCAEQATLIDGLRALRDADRIYKKELEERLAVFEQPEEPTSNPFREFPGDRRRVGG